MHGKSPKARPGDATGCSRKRHFRNGMPHRAASGMSVRLLERNGLAPLRGLLDYPNHPSQELLQDLFESPDVQQTVQAFVRDQERSLVLARHRSREERTTVVDTAGGGAVVSTSRRA